MKTAFDSAHQSRFGHSNSSAPIEFVIARTTGFGDLGRAEPSPLEQSPSGSDSESRPVRFGATIHDTPLVRRAELAPRSRMHGPLIISEATATTVIPPGWRLEVDGYGVLLAARVDEDPEESTEL